MTTTSADNIAQWSLRIALAAGFLSAVADRFGLWGAPGLEGVAWGAWQPFVDYTAILLWFLPSSLVAIFALVATLLEVGLALGLLVGWHLKWFALGSAVLLTIFAVTMTIALGIKAPLDYSVFGVATAAFLLASRPNT